MFNNIPRYELSYNYALSCETLSTSRTVADFLDQLWFVTDEFIGQHGCISDDIKSPAPKLTFDQVDLLVSLRKQRLNIIEGLLGGNVLESNVGRFELANLSEQICSILSSYVDTSLDRWEGLPVLSKPQIKKMALSLLLQ